MSKFTQPSNSGKKVDPRMPPGSIWAVMVGLLLVALFAFSLARGSAGRTDRPASGDQVNPAPVVSDRQDMEAAVSIPPGRASQQAHPPENAPDEMALKNAFQPKCDHLPYCDYLQEHIVWGSQLAVEVPLALAVPGDATFPNCESQPICGYILAHSTGGRQVDQSASLPVTGDDSQP